MTSSFKLSKLRKLIDVIDNCITTEEVRNAFEDWEAFKAEIPTPNSLNEEFIELLDGDVEVIEEVDDDDVISFDAEGVGYNRGWGNYFFYFGIDHVITTGASSQDEKNLLLELSNALPVGCTLGDHLHARQLFWFVKQILAFDNIDKFMIGKCSNKKIDHLHMGMQSRFGSKYREKGYSGMIGLVVLDGGAGKRMQETALNIESQVRALFVDEECFDEKLSKSTSGKIVKEDTEHNYYFLVYLAVKFKSA